MSKNKYKTTQNGGTSKTPPQTASSKRPLFFIGGLLIVAAGLVVFLLGSAQPASDYEPEVTGSARAEVDQERIDHGDVSFEKPVSSVFTVSNVGDEPLYILGQPQVETLEGC